MSEDMHGGERTGSDRCCRGPKCQWTVMVYFASDDVDQYDVENLEKLKKAGSTDEVALLAQVDPTGNKQSTRYWLNRETKLEEDVVRRFPNLSAGSPDALIDFVKWGTDAAPAAHNMVLIWGHGDGWQNEDNAGRAAGRTINVNVHKQRIKSALGLGGVKCDQIETLLDRLAFLPNRDAGGLRAPDVLDGPALKKVFATLRECLDRKIDLLGMDSCLMAMIEVAYQVRDEVEYMVASEDVTPVGSWPYDSIFKELIRRPTVSPSELGQIIVRQYLIEYLDQTRFVTQSVCRPALSENLAEVVNKLAEELKEGLKNDRTCKAIMSARAMVQDFYIKDYVDLYNFCDILAEILGESHGLTPLCKSVMRITGRVSGSTESPDTFVTVHGFYGYPLRGSHGASIYFPCSGFSTQYDQLDFAKTKWRGFIESYAAMLNGSVVASGASPGGTAPGGHLGGMLGDGQLGPGDPVSIPPDPLNARKPCK